MQSLFLCKNLMRSKFSLYIFEHLWGIRIPLVELQKIERLLLKLQCKLRVAVFFICYRYTNAIRYWQHNKYCPTDLAAKDGLIPSKNLFLKRIKGIENGLKSFWTHQTFFSVIFFSLFFLLTVSWTKSSIKGFLTKEHTGWKIKEMRQLVLAVDL